MNLSEKEYVRIDELVSPLLKQGQPVKHICKTQKERLFVSESTLYRIIDCCRIGARNIDLPRKVRFKVRAPKSAYYKVDKTCRINRKYEDFITFQKDAENLPVVKADSVEEEKGGKVLLTLLLTNCNLQPGFIRDSNDSQSVTDITEELYKTPGDALFRCLLPVILAENGTEFSNPSKIENAPDSSKRTNVFYCHPSSPFEKGKCENNHELVRRIFPKEHSLDSFTQEDIDLAFSHISSYGRPQYNNKYPAGLFIGPYGEKILHLLRNTRIALDSIILKPSLLNH